MNRIELKKSIVLTFEEYMKVITTESHYSVKMNKNIDVTLDKFIDWLDSELSTPILKRGTTRISFEYLVRYFDFGFNYWLWRYDEDPSRYKKYGLKSFQLGWLIGVDARKRFKNNSSKVEFLKPKRQLRNAKVDILTKLKAQEKEQKEAFIATFLSGSNEIEEEEKEMFYNTPEGFLNCIANTTLMNPKSELCMKCNLRQRCKEVLKREIPNIYKIRFNE